MFLDVFFTFLYVKHELEYKNLNGYVVYDALKQWKHSIEFPALSCKVCACFWQLYDLTFSRNFSVTTFRERRVIWSFAVAEVWSSGEAKSRWSDKAPREQAQTTVGRWTGGGGLTPQRTGTDTGQTTRHLLSARYQRIMRSSTQPFYSTFLFWTSVGLICLGWCEICVIFSEAFDVLWSLMTFWAQNWHTDYSCPG